MTGGESVSSKPWQKRETFPIGSMPIKTTARTPQPVSPLCSIGALVPTSNEGTSNTLLEYMAAGLPVIATDCGGNAGLLGPDSTRGLLLPSNPTPAQTATHWLTLLRDTALSHRLGTAAREFVLARHAPEVVLDRWEKFYRGVCP